MMLSVMGLPFCDTSASAMTGEAAADDAVRDGAAADKTMTEANTLDDEIIVAVEQWPECLNPVTHCRNSLGFPRILE